MVSISWKDTSAFSVGILLFLTTNSSNSATLTKGPVSASVPAGENALFHCTGVGLFIQWVVDGLNQYSSIIIERGISSVTYSSSGTVYSTLTIPATPLNNDTTMNCRVYSFSGSAISNNATLIVLPGIGQVNNLRFSSTFGYVLWDPPVIFGVLGSVFYAVTVINNNTGQVIANSTISNTNYPLPALQLCQYYTVNVTAFSSEYQSVTFTGQRTPGAYYQISVSQTVVAHYNATQFAVSFEISIQQWGWFVCPHQNLIVLTHPINNSSDTTVHTKLSITQSGTVHHTVLVKRRCHYTCNINIVANDRTVRTKTVNFSTFNVQSCDASTDYTNMLVECTFAINTTASSWYITVEDEQHEHTIGRTLKKSCDKGIAIVIAPAGKYNVRVYDQYQDSIPAYVHSDVLTLQPPTGSAASSLKTSILVNRTLEPTLSFPATKTSSVNNFTFNTTLDSTSPIYSISPTHEIQNIMIITVTTVISGILVLLVFGICVSFCCVAFVTKMRRKQRTNVSDHVQVDDNPAYVTMKKIAMSKNSIYENVDITPRN